VASVGMRDQHQEALLTIPVVPAVRMRRAEELEPRPQAVLAGRLLSQIRLMIVQKEEVHPATMVRSEWVGPVQPMPEVEVAGTTGEVEVVVPFRTRAAYVLRPQAEEAEGVVPPSSETLRA
jgi:hypothetical protein